MSQCRWFGGTVNAEQNQACSRPASVRIGGAVLCDLHWEAAEMDPDEWTDEMKAENA